MDKKITEYVETLIKRASMESEWYPVDRTFVEKNMDVILTFDPKLFIFENYNIGSQLWAINLSLCLPEVWEKVNAEDIILMLESFTTSVAYYSLMEFTYKYIGIDILPFVLRSKNVQENYIEDIKLYLKNQWNNLLMTNKIMEELHSNDEYMHIKFEIRDWEQIRQNYLTIDKIGRSKSNLSDLGAYIYSLLGEAPSGWG